MTFQRRRAPAPPAEPSLAPPAPSWVRRAATAIGKTAVACFALWHMFAVGVYAVPGAAEDRFAAFTQSTLLPVVRTYTLLTSQWQQWNLFAPDPLRRITYYRISAAAPEGWRDVTTLQPGSFPWWRHANRFKLLLGIMEGSNPEVAERFAHTLCTIHRLKPGGLIRITYLVSIVPWTPSPQSSAVWRSWNYPFEEDGSFEATCPDPPITVL